MNGTVRGGADRWRSEALGLAAIALAATLLFGLTRLDIWLTDVDGTATLRVPAAAFERVIVRVGRGNIRVADRTRARGASAGAVALELHADRGRIVR